MGLLEVFYHELNLKPEISDSQSPGDYDCSDLAGHLDWQGDAVTKSLLNGFSEMNGRGNAPLFRRWRLLLIS